jgi:hypothetical protein
MPLKLFMEVRDYTFNTYITAALKKMGAEMSIQETSGRRTERRRFWTFWTPQLQSVYSEKISATTHHPLGLITLIAEDLRGPFTNERSPNMQPLAGDALPELSFDLGDHGGFVLGSAV